MILFLLFSSLFTLEANTLVESEGLRPFETDLCTYFSEGTNDEPNLWAHCCIKHDLAYWVAGKRSEQKRADLELRSCVAEVATPYIANLMYRGVLFGHLSPIKNRYKWGWSRSKRRRKYQELSEYEIGESLEFLARLDEFDQALISEFIEFRFQTK